MLGAPCSPPIQILKGSFSAPLRMHDVSEQDCKVRLPSGNAWHRQSRCTLGIRATDLAFGSRRSLHGLLGDIHPAAQRRCHALILKSHCNGLQPLGS